MIISRVLRFNRICSLLTHRPQKMTYYQLFDYNGISWSNFLNKSTNTEFKSLADIQKFVFDDLNELKSIENLMGHLKECEIVNVFNHAKTFALKMPDLIPSGKILRLTKNNLSVEFNRLQVLCILCHMLLCTLKKTNQNNYWVTFENWLTDGRPCAVVYLKTLIEYFRQSFIAFKDVEQNFMKETISFKRIKCESAIEESLFQNSSIKLCKVDLRLQGGIGDASMNEVDFANCDIGYGVTGTQEEILFGASPEMCVAMLFCDTMLDEEAIIIKGARRVGLFEGYGLNLKFKSLASIESKPWKDRCVIAIDAMDFSEHTDSFKIQIQRNSLQRELKKSIAGFSAVINGTIDTGHWGCGAFCGNRYIKSIIQLIASSIQSNNLVYFCHGDIIFYESFKSFINILQEKNVSVENLWKALNSELREDDDVFTQIIRHLEK
jgi:poly(ADP-ribose) glycohydrolase